jgi:hypothetical protein
MSLSPSVEPGGERGRKNLENAQNQLGFLKKVATDKGKNKAIDFESMLRRHLSRGGAPVSACTGFDPDTASSYLEGALWSKSRMRYEAHLAGCPSCRQQLIGLSRLSQLAVINEAPSVPAIRESSYWAYWKSMVVRRFENQIGVSSWRWNLAMAGSTIAACGVLIAVLLSQPWWQAVRNSPPKSEIAPNSVGYFPIPSPTPMLDPSSEAAHLAANHQHDSQPTEKSMKPVLPPLDTRLLIASEPLSSELNKNESTDKIDAKVARFGAIAGSGSIGGVVQPPVSTPTKLANNGEKREDAKAKAAAGSQVAQNSQHLAGDVGNFKLPQESADSISNFDSGIGPRITQQLEDNANKSRRDSENAKDNKTLAQGTPASKPSWISRTMLRGWAPNRRAEAEQNTADNNENEEGEKYLIRYVRHKTFSYQRGFWVDHEYKPEVDMYRVTHIARGTKEFEALLSKEPQLKDFSSLGKFIIVWRGEIYRIK